MLPMKYECPGKENFSTYSHNMAKAAKMAISMEAQKRLIRTLYTNQLERAFFCCCLIEVFWISFKLKIHNVAHGGICRLNMMGHPRRSDSPLEERESFRLWQRRRM